MNNLDLFNKDYALFYSHSKNVILGLKLIEKEVSTNYLLKSLSTEEKVTYLKDFILKKSNLNKQSKDILFNYLNIFLKS